MQVVACAAEPIVITIVDDREVFLGLETEWNDAVDRAAIPHPFLRHEWLRTWWDCFGGDGRLHILVARLEGRIVAIAPLMSETARMFGVPIRRLRLMHNDHTPRADVIVAGQPDAAYHAIWSALRAQRDRWDVIQLGQIPGDSTTRVQLPAIAAEDGCLHGLWRSSESPYLRLAGTWDAYSAGLSGKFRQNLRNRVSRLRRIGEPVLEQIVDGPGLDAACTDAIRLEASGWKQQAGTSIASNGAVNRFYISLASTAAACGWLRLQFLNVGGRRIAASYSLSYGNRLFLVKTGYDPEFNACSPFKVLTSLVIQDAIDRGFDEVDFLGETEPWKREWTSSVRSHEWLFIFSNTSRARIVYPLKFKVAPAAKSMWSRS